MSLNGVLLWWGEGDKPSLFLEANGFGGGGKIEADLRLSIVVGSGPVSFQWVAKQSDESL